MGYYLNPGSGKFVKRLKSAIYVDKSGLIGKLNPLIQTEEYVCLSRPRRFGKTMAMNMLAAYYGMGEDATPLFEALEVGKTVEFKKHLNQYHCLAINMDDFLFSAGSINGMVKDLEAKLIKELVKAYPDLSYTEKDQIVEVMDTIHKASGRPFIILIDEWDCVFREQKGDKEGQKNYLKFLKFWLKDKEYVGLAYMTGILPIKKYGTHSALNMFIEYSMTDPRPLESYFGFTSEEVAQLCSDHEMSLEEMKVWYNGYFKESGNSIYNPFSVTTSIEKRQFNNYWNKTEHMKSLQDYIRLDYDGLRDKIIQAIGGELIEVDPDAFANDMTTFATADDVLALLIHLGYLSYDFETKSAKIPNNELRAEFRRAIKDLPWDGVVSAIKNAQKLLEAIWNNDAEQVAIGIEDVHEKNTSILNYNDENALSFIIRLALYTTTEYYTIIRELPSGKGFADLVFIPRPKHSDKPAMVVELKWNKTAAGAIQQIKAKNYASALKEYKRNLLLVGINYQKETKKHVCVIEKYDWE